jgi:hypothetical protein
MGATSVNGFTFYSLKLNDYAAKCPWMKNPLFTVDGDGKCKSQLQSKNMQIPLKVVIRKEDHTIFMESLLTSLPISLPPPLQLRVHGVFSLPLPQLWQ